MPTHRMSGITSSSTLERNAATCDEGTLPFTARVGKRRGTTESADEREGQESGAETPGQLLQDTEHGREDEAAQATGGADHSGRDADLLGEAVRDELEDRAVSHSQNRHDR